MNSAFQRHETFGSGVAPLANSAVAAVPEPAALGLLLTAAIASLPLGRKLARRTRLAVDGETLPSA